MVFTVCYCFYYSHYFECKPSFDGKKFPTFQNKKADVENDTADDSTAKARSAFGKRTSGKFPAMKRGFQFAGVKG